MFKKIWSTLTGSSPEAKNAHKESDLEEHRRIIRAYGAYIQVQPIDGTEIRDVTALPYPKERILDALKSAIIYEKNDQIIEIMIGVGILLAYFQRDIGTSPITPFGDVSFSELQEAVMKKDLNIMKDLQQRMLNNPFKEQFASLSSVAQQEQAEIKKDLDAAKILGNAITSAIKPYQS